MRTNDWEQDPAGGGPRDVRVTTTLENGLRSKVAQPNTTTRASGPTLPTGATSPRGMRTRRPRRWAALRTFLAHRGLEGETVLLKALNCLQGARYPAVPGCRKNLPHIEPAEVRPQKESFVYGWLRERVAI